MLKEEFERIAKIEVEEETYKKVIEPMYMATDLSKEEFVKTLNLKTFAKKQEKNIKKMSVSNGFGERKTPNGCWYYVRYVELIDIDIAKGKYIVKDMNQFDYSYDYDFADTQCIIK